MIIYIESPEKSDGPQCYWIGHEPAPNEGAAGWIEDRVIHSDKEAAQWVRDTFKADSGYSAVLMV